MDVRRIFVSHNIDVVVASFGGVGTTFLIEFLSRLKKTNDYKDRDGFKHLPIPPISFNKKIRFVFVFGDPIMATLSIFRRNYQHWQSEKLLRFNDKRISPINVDVNIDEYASSGTDKFLFRNQFCNWYENYLYCPTIFIRYEKMWEIVEILTRFLDLPDSISKYFPKKQRRKTDLSSISIDTYKKLGKIYEHFIKELNELKDVEIKYRNLDNKRHFILNKKVYRNAIKQQLLDCMNLNYKKIFHR